MQCKIVSYFNNSGTGLSVLLRLSWMAIYGMAFCAAHAQPYPSKTIRIVAAQAGGTGDITARLIAQGLSASFGHQVIVDNRGGSGVVAAELVAKKSAPDGYTLLAYGSNIWLLPFLTENLPYDPIKDLAPVTISVRSPTVIVVHPSLPVNSVKGLIALAKSRPGELSYGSGGIGGAPHIAAELFNSVAGTNIVRINYKGEGPAFIDLIGGQIQLMFPAAGVAMPHVRAGKLRALAVASSQPSPLAPGLAPASLSGLPGYEAGSVHVLFAPAGTPGAIIDRINQEVVRYLNQPEVKDRLFTAGMEPVGSSPEEALNMIRSAMAKLGKVIRDSGIKS